MMKFHRRLHKGHASLEITDYAKKEVEEVMYGARRYLTMPSSEYVAQVFLPQGASDVVDWAEGTRTCQEFQDRLLPCAHAMAMARDARLDSFNKISAVYGLLVYRNTYQQSLHPIQIETLASSEACLSPIPVPTRGRPKTRRFWSDRGTTRRKCGQCGREGHTRTTCRQ